MSTTYQTMIPQVHHNGDEQQQQQHQADEESNALFGASIDLNDRSQRNHKKSSRVLLASVTAVVLLVVVVGLRSNSNTATASAPSSSSSLDLTDLPVEGEPTARACTFMECLGTNCNPDAAPYECLFHNGGPHGGCSPVPWSAFTCDEDCDTSVCATLPLPADFGTCAGKKCPDGWCSSGQLCGDAAPYQCTDGAARFGCSDDEYHWMFGNGCIANYETDYYTCCDITTCE